MPAAILLVEFAGDDRGELLTRLDRLVELMSDLGQPGSVVKMPDERAQKALWEVRKAGLNIMMSLKGDGKPVSFIEDCAVPLEHLADYTDAADRGVRPPRHARHLVRARVGRHAARAADPRHARATAAAPQDARRSPKRRGELVRKYKGAFSGEHGDGLCRGEWIAWQFGPAHRRGLPRDQAAVRPEQPLQPRPDRRPAEDGRRRAVPLRAAERLPSRSR